MSGIVVAGYVPGNWVGMAGTQMWLLADLDPGDPVVMSCWELVKSRASVHDVLAAMVGTQVRPALNIAIVRLDGAEAEVVVRGDAWADVDYRASTDVGASAESANGSHADSGFREVRAAPGAFGGCTVTGFTAVRLHGPTGADQAAASPAPLELGTGVVPAAQIAIRAGLAPSPPDAMPTPGSSEGSAEPVGRFDAMFGATTLPEQEEEHAAAIPAEWLAGMRPQEGVGASPGGHAPPPAPGLDPAASVLLPPAEPTPSAAPPNSETRPPEHTSAATPPARDGAYRSPFEGPLAGSYRPAPPAAPPPAPGVGGGGLIEDVSWAAVADNAYVEPDHYSYPSAPSYPASPPHPQPGPPYPPGAYPAAAPGYPAPNYPPAPPPPYPAPAPPPAYPAPAPPPAYPAPAPPPAYPAPAPYPVSGPPAAAGGIDAELMKTTRRGPSTPAAPGLVVGAVRCSSGHPNPPAAQRCRACAGPVPPQTPQPMPRPPLGVLRLSTGEVVTLDRGVILGRAPGAPQGFERDEPHRIQLPSPDGSISRKHVEVVLTGWLVTVVDLDSMNGTMVTPPGGKSEIVPPGGRRVIDNGCVVTLDTTTWFRFEVTP